MKAIVQERYGSADVLELREIERPRCGDDDVLVQVRAAGVDPGVWHLMTGLPYLVRFMGFGLRAPKLQVRGRDVAGVVDAVGKNVKSLSVGAAVFGICEGSFAEYARAPEASFAPKPTNLSFEQAAAVPISAASALNALQDAKLRAGQHLLVIGAAGGVGSYAVQLGKAFGAVVTGVCSSTKIELVRRLGADEVVDYTRVDITEGTRKFDVIVDMAGRRPVSRLRRVLAETGCLVIVGGEGGGPWLGGFERQMLAPLGGLFSQQRLLGLTYQERREDLLTLKSLIEAGKLLPVIDKTYPLAEAANAIRHLEQGHAGGKVVLKVS